MRGISECEDVRERDGTELVATDQFERMTAIRLYLRSTSGKPDGEQMSGSPLPPGEGLGVRVLAT
jgi:hypothetical protein